MEEKIVKMYVVDGVNVIIDGDGGTFGEISENEVQAYIDRGRALQPKEKLESVHIHLDGDEVDLENNYENRDFERIRRITGYLVGTLDRFNNAKAAEVNDRVKHSIDKNDAMLKDCEDIYID